MRNKDDLTPRMAANDIMIGWLAAAARGRTGDAVNASEMASGMYSERFELETRRQLAKLHNRLADKYDELGYMHIEID